MTDFGHSEIEIYITWANSILNEQGVFVESLKDFQDGSLLCILVDSLCPCAGLENRSQSCEGQTIQNTVQSVLEYMRTNGIRLDVQTSDIIQGNTKSVHELLWLIFLHFSLHSSERTPYQRTIQIGRRLLLNWCSGLLQDANLDDKKSFVENFTGNCYLTNLINKLTDVKEPVISEDLVVDLTQAVERADDELGISKSVIRPVDVIEGTIEETALIIYVTLLRRKASLRKDCKIEPSFGFPHSSMWPPGDMSSDYQMSPKHNSPGTPQMFAQTLPYDGAIQLLMEQQAKSQQAIQSLQKQLKSFETARNDTFKVEDSPPTDSGLDTGEHLGMSNASVSTFRSTSLSYYQMPEYPSTTPSRNLSPNGSIDSVIDKGTGLRKGTDGSKGNADDIDTMFSRLETPLEFDNKLADMLRSCSALTVDSPSALNTWRSDATSQWLDSSAGSRVLTSNANTSELLDNNARSYLLTSTPDVGSESVDTRCLSGASTLTYNDRTLTAADDVDGDNALMKAISEKVLEQLGGDFSPEPDTINDSSNQHQKENSYTIPSIWDELFPPTPEPKNLKSSDTKTVHKISSSTEVPYLFSECGDELMSLLESINLQGSTLKCELEQANRRESDLREQVRNDNSDELEKTISSLKREVEILRNENDKLHREVATAQTVNINSKVTMESLQEQVEKLRNQLRCLERESVANKNDKMGPGGDAMLAYGTDSDGEVQSQRKGHKRRLSPKRRSRSRDAHPDSAPAEKSPVKKDDTMLLSDLNCLEINREVEMSSGHNRRSPSSHRSPRRNDQIDVVSPKQEKNKKHNLSMNSINKETRVPRLQQLLASATIENEILQAKLNSANKRLSTQVELMENLLKDTKDEVVNLKDVNEDLRINNESQMLKVGCLELQVKEMEKSVSSATADNEHLNTQLNEALDSLRKSIKSPVKGPNIVERENMKLREKIAIADEERNRLRQDLSWQRYDDKKVNETLRALEVSLDSAQSEKRLLQTELGIVRDNYDYLKKEIVILEKHHKDKEAIRLENVSNGYLISQIMGSDSREIPNQLHNDSAGEFNNYNHHRRSQSESNSHASSYLAHNVDSRSLGGITEANTRHCTKDAMESDASTHDDVRCGEQYSPPESVGSQRSAVADERKADILVIGDEHYSDSSQDDDLQISKNIPEYSPTLSGTSSYTPGSRPQRNAIPSGGSKDDDLIRHSEIVVERLKKRISSGELPSAIPANMANNINSTPRETIPNYKDNLETPGYSTRSLRTKDVLKSEHSRALSYTPGYKEGGQTLNVGKPLMSSSPAAAGGTPTNRSDSWLVISPVATPLAQSSKPVDGQELLKKAVDNQRSLNTRDATHSGSYHNTFPLVGSDRENSHIANTGQEYSHLPSTYSAVKTTDPVSTITSANIFMSKVKHSPAVYPHRRAKTGLNGNGSTSSVYSDREKKTTGFDKAGRSDAKPYSSEHGAQENRIKTSPSSDLAVSPDDFLSNRHTRIWNGTYDSASDNKEMSTCSKGNSSHKEYKLFDKSRTKSYTSDFSNGQKSSSPPDGLKSDLYNNRSNWYFEGESTSDYRRNQGHRGAGLRTPRDFGTVGENSSRREWYVDRSEEKAPASQLRDSPRSSKKASNFGRISPKQYDYPSVLSCIESSQDVTVIERKDYNSSIVSPRNDSVLHGENRQSSLTDSSKKYGSARNLSAEFESSGQQKKVSLSPAEKKYADEIIEKYTRRSPRQLQAAERAISNSVNGHSYSPRAVKPKDPESKPTYTWAKAAQEPHHVLPEPPRRTRKISSTTISSEDSLWTNPEDFQPLRYTDTE